MPTLLRRALRSTIFWLVLAVIVAAVVRVIHPHESFDEVDTGAVPLEVGADADGVWVLNHGEGTLSRIDTARHEVAFAVDVPGAAPRLSVDDDGAWVLLDDGATLARVDADERAVGLEVDVAEALGAPATDLAAGDGVVWVTARDEQRMVAVDPSEGEVVETVDLDGPVAQPLVVDGALWAQVGGDLARFDATDGDEQDTVALDLGVHDFVVDGGDVIALVDVGRDDQTSFLVRLDPRSGDEEGRMALPAPPSHLTLVDDRVWVASADGMLIEATASPLRFVREEQVTVSTRDLQGLVAHDDELWVADGDEGVAYLSLAEVVEPPEAGGA